MNIHELISSVSDPLPSSELRIRTFNNVTRRLDDIRDSVLWHTKSINKKHFKKVYFKDGTWYAQNNKQTNIVTLDQNNEFSFQIKAYALLKLFSGNVEGGIGLKASTVAGHTLILNTLANFLAKKKFTSFHQFCKSPQIIISNTLNEYLFKELKAQEHLPKREYSTIFDETNSYGLLDKNVCDIFHGQLTAIQDSFHKITKKTLSHPVIPTRILKKIIKRARKKIKAVEDKLDDWVDLNDKLLERLEIRHSYTKTVSDGATIIRNALNNVDTNDDFDSKFDCFKDLKISVLIYILAFTGMRIDEALSCKLGCAFEKDGNFYVQSIMSKTDSSTITLDWVANEDTYNAVKLLERFVLNMRKRGECLLDFYSQTVKEDNLHNIEFGLAEKKLFGVAHSMKSISFSNDGRFASFDDTSGTPHEMLNISIEDCDIEQLERLECNFKNNKGKDRGIAYSVGDKIRISAHMFRHTFAWFIIANRLGELDDIKYQFNHLSTCMSMVYANRGIGSVDEILDLISYHEEILTKKVASEIAQEGVNGTLGGGGGERFNKIASDLIIGITNSDMEDSNRINQIHFKDMNQYVLFLQKNLKNIKGLPHGYCTGGDACKIKNAGLPSGCVYCPSYTVVEKQMVHWRAMKKGASDKLKKYNSMTIEVKQRYELLAINWQDTIDAANQIIKNFDKNNKNNNQEAAVNV
ncbi:hypothetical protein [Colwellia sp. BRX10-4]|uniref:hypothetical protein n=1 Tax=Colwellia sp. BRX10-4 TaxID=2759843 RepID=UPI0015F76FD5|nr:hypothetical protein [Colwellia sp. BRX10-4]MBA6398919.1 hypothetical protein [Colwellia sp. BRX10-4]